MVLTVIQIALWLIVARVSYVRGFFKAGNRAYTMGGLRVIQLLDNRDPELAKQVFQDMVKEAK